MLIVIITWKLQLSSLKNVALKDIKIRNDFNIMLRNKFDILRNLEPENNVQVTSIDKKWEEISNLHKKLVKNVLDIGKKQRNKEWMRPRTWKMISSFKDAKQK